MSETVVRNFKARAFIYSLNKDKMRPEVMDEITVLEQIDRDEYIVDYKGVKCHAMYNWFVGAYFADDIYGIVKD